MPDTTSPTPPNPYVAQNPYVAPVPPPYSTGGQAYVYAVITGHIALSQIKRTGEGGRGMAIAGIVVGYAVTAFALLYILAMVALFGAMWSSGSS